MLANLMKMIGKKLILLLLFIPLVSFGQVKNGEFKSYYESGELQFTVNYVDGLRQGEGKWYYKSGELESTANYVDSLKQGEGRFYDESGELQYTINYEDDCC